MNSTFVLQASLCSKLCFDHNIHTQKPSCLRLQVLLLLQCGVKFLFWFQAEFLNIHTCSISPAEILGDRAMRAYTFALTVSTYPTLLSAYLVNSYVFLLWNLLYCLRKSVHGISPSCFRLPKQQSRTTAKLTTPLYLLQKSSTVFERH